MLQTSLHQQFNCIAKQGGLMSTYWSAINPSNYDRTSEVRGVREE